MKVLFLRHGKLRSPYDNYDELTLKQLELLATQKIDPSIDLNFAKTKINEYIAVDFLKKKSFDKIYHSPSKRTYETASLLGKRLKVGFVCELSSLSEISFRPSKLVTDKEYRLHGMPLIRNAVFRAISKNKLDEAVERYLRRLENIEEVIRKEEDKNLIFVTHGFFMRLIQIYFLMKKKRFTVKNLSKVENYSYLDGFYLDSTYRTSPD